MSPSCAPPGQAVVVACLESSSPVKVFFVGRLYVHVNGAGGGLPGAHASHDQEQGHDHRIVQQIVDGGHEDDSHKSMAKVEVFYVGAGQRKPDHADDRYQLKSLKRDQAEESVDAEGEQPQSGGPQSAVPPPVPLAGTEDGLLEGQIDGALVVLQAQCERAAMDSFEKLSRRMNRMVAPHQRAHRDGVCQAQPREEENRRYKQNRHHPGKITAADEDKGQQRDQQNDGAAGLAEQGRAAQYGGRPHGRNAENAVHAAAKP